MSLRDVDRTLQVMMWFFNHKVLFELMDRKAAAEANPGTDEEELAPFEVVGLFLCINVLLLPSSMISSCNSVILANN